MSGNSFHHRLREVLFRKGPPTPCPDKYFSADQGGRGEAIEAYFCTLIEPSPKSNEDSAEKDAVRMLVK